MKLKAEVPICTACASSAARSLPFSAMRVLITGAGGMLGKDLIAACTDAGHDVTARARAELDITQAGMVTDAVRESTPEVVFNCAAYTNVDGAEAEIGPAFEINGDGAANVARACAEAGAWVIHLSSDYVFDGAKREPYVESDHPEPLSQYGASKLAGERAVAQEAPERHTVVRSSWLFGTGGPCFPATMLRLARERGEVTVVDDQVGCPTYTGHLAAALLSLAQSPPVGIVHLAAAGECSWYRFAVEVIAAAGVRCEVKPGTTEDTDRPAPRPAYSVLGSELTGVPTLPDWGQGLSAYMAEGMAVR